MEEFSQSRGDDDLFNDEVVPVPSQQVDIIASQIQELSLDKAPTGPSSNTRGHGPRGRGRGQRSRASNDLMTSRYAPQSEALSQPQPRLPQPPQEGTRPPISTPAEQTLPNNSKTVSEIPQFLNGETHSNISNNNADTATSTGAPLSETAPSRPPAVRGDRTATGGIKKPKLTEDELAAKLAAAKERSQNLSAAHARAQADAASFEQRERIAQEKRAKDAVNRKAMDNERERNRERKLKGMGGREWDAEKDEGDLRSRERGNGFFRGAHGAVRHDRRQQQQQEFGTTEDAQRYEPNEDRGRGRGARGRGRGRGRGAPFGQSQARDANGTQFSQQPDVNAEAEFPTLPTASKPQDTAQRVEESANAKSVSEGFSPPVEGGSTWADQVEAAAPQRA